MKKFSFYEEDDNIVWSGNSVFEPRDVFFPESPELEMMGQDAGSTIWGQCHDRHGRGGRGFSTVSFKFKPESKKVIDFFCTLVHDRHGDINYQIAQFLDMIARTIIVDGFFVYELKIGKDKNTNQIVRMNFSPVSAPNSKMFIFGKHAFQLLPSITAKEHGCSRFRILNSDNTFIFQPPPKWKNVLKKAGCALHFYDAMKFRLMKQITDSMQSSNSYNSNYDNFTNIKLLAKATAPLGWSGRSLFQGYQSDYLGIERLIRWNRFCIDLRNHMILTLRAAVNRISTLLEVDCELVVEEKSGYSLDDIQKKLQEGKTSTVELVRLLF